MIRRYLRKDLSDYQPYHAPLKEYKIKMDNNELAYGHEADFMASIKQWMENDQHLTRYPDTDCQALSQALGRLWKVEQENILCGVGSDQLIDCFLKVFLEVGDKVMMPKPSFSMYSLTARLNHGTVLEFELEEDFSYPIDRMIELYQKQKPKVVILCTPNNPTGNSLSIDDIKRLLEVINCPVLIDEAYAEYTGISMIEHIQSYPNIIVLRTFSKALGLAGLRVGYGIGSEAIIKAVAIAKPPYNLNALSMVAAQKALENMDYFNKKVQQTIQNRQWLAQELKKLNVIDKVYPSDTNFILIRPKIDNLSLYLERNKILVRSFSKDPLKGCIRITTGTMEENKILIDTIKNYKSVQ